MEMSEEEDIVSLSLELVEDIEPEALRQRCETRIRETPIFPAKLTAYLASESAEGVSPTRRSSLVHIFHAGLAENRDLVREEPWEVDSEAASEADLDVLTSEILVAKTVYHLAESPAIDSIVDAILEFAAVETASGSETSPGEASFERLVLEAAIAVGVDGRLDSERDKQLVSEAVTDSEDGFTDQVGVEELLG